MIIIVWQGWGWLLLPLLVIGISIVEFLGFSLFPDIATFQKLLGIGLLLTAPLVWFLGRYLHYGEIPFVTNKNNPPEFRVRGEHSLYYIPFEYWAAIMGFIGFLVIVN